MFRCLTCESKGIINEYDNINGLSKHIRWNADELHGGSQKGYYDKYMIKEGEGICQNPNCPNGNPETTFQGMGKGYSAGCCKSCAQKVPGVSNKIKATCKEKYGTEHHLQNKSILEKQKKTNIERYGVENITQVKEIKDRGIATRIAKMDEINENRRQTCLEKYGVDNVMKLRTNKEKLSKLFINISKDDIIKRLNEFNIEVLEYTRCADYCKFKCSTCKYEFTSKPNWLFNYSNKCPNCDKKIYGEQQQEIYNFCSTYFNNIILNDRSILDGKEIDIYIPGIKLGIEYDGLYWHKESTGIDRNYHLDKTNLSESKGIDLIHIFEDEWMNKSDIIKSMLKYRFGKMENKISARDCSVIIPNRKDSFIFIKENHIQIPLIGSINIGLSYNNELVSIMTFKKSRFNKNYEWEILRFCSKKDFSIVGGLSRLLSHFISTYNPKSIITYADARFGKGKGYENAGFKLINKSTPNYYYIVEGGKRESRIKYQKHRLEKILESFDSNLSEYENMKANGYDRIWDCGNYVYGWSELPHPRGVRLPTSTTELAF